MTSCAKSTAKLLVGNHSNGTHQRVIFSTTGARLVSAVMSSLLIAPPSCISGHSHDLTSFGIDDDSTDTTSDAMVLCILSSSTCNLQELCRRRGVKLSMDTSELIERRCILKKLCRWIELCRPVSLRPEYCLFCGQGCIAWYDGVEATRQPFIVNVLCEGLTDLIPW